MGWFLPPGRGHLDSRNQSGIMKTAGFSCAERMIQMIKERLSRLREKMAEKGVGLYMVTSSDFHNSEYVGDYFKERAFITGFTGSARSEERRVRRAMSYTNLHT